MTKTLCSDQRRIQRVGRRARVRRCRSRHLAGSEFRWIAIFVAYYSNRRRTIGVTTAVTMSGTDTAALGYGGTRLLRIPVISFPPGVHPPPPPATIPLALTSLRPFIRPRYCLATSAAAVPPPTARTLLVQLPCMRFKT